MFIRTPPTGFSRALSLVSPPNFSEICDMHELPWFAVLGILSHDRNAASPRLSRDTPLWIFLTVCQAGSTAFGTAP